MQIKNEYPLAQTTIIVTRPQPQNISLCQSLEKLGADVIALPSLAIKSKALQPDAMPLSPPVNSHDIAIFLSANAVQNTHSFWKSQTALPQFFAIGPGTAQALQTVGLPLTGIPLDYSSEGLLALDELQHVTGRRIFICSGAESRPLLAETLKQRGANVIPIICYERYRPRLQKNKLQQLNPKNQTISITTSKESLVNFHKMLTEANFTWLLNQPLLVSHPRHDALAKQLGFQYIVVANNPTNAQIIARLIDLTGCRKGRWLCQLLRMVNYYMVSTKVNIV